MTGGRRAGWVAVVLLALAGCGGSDPTKIQVDFTAGNGVNPNSKGQASPVVVRVYALQQTDSFTGAQFWDLYLQDQNTLGAAMVSKNEFELTPGEQKQFVREVEKTTKFIGVMAAFRDIENAQWQATSTVEAEETNEYEVSLDASSLNLVNNGTSGWF